MTDQEKKDYFDAKISQNQQVHFHEAMPNPIMNAMDNTTNYYGG